MFLNGESTETYGKIYQGHEVCITLRCRSGVLRKGNTQERGEQLWESMLRERRMDEWSRHWWSARLQ